LHHKKIIVQKSATFSVFRKLTWVKSMLELKSREEFINSSYVAHCLHFIIPARIEISIQITSLFFADNFFEVRVMPF
jgi:hypothetical protein